MPTPSSILQPILKSPDMWQLLEELNRQWQLEQERRHRFWEAVDGTVKAEFINGEEIMYRSPVCGRHWMASKQLMRYLLPYVYDNRLGKVGYEKVMIRCTRNDYEPDVCFWTQERAATFEPHQSVFPPPDFVVEILSESTQERDRGIKMQDYATHNVQEYWLIDPDERTVEQYLLNEGKFSLHLKLNEEGTLHSVVIQGFSIPLKNIFQE
ncbi:Uma2 family endonuclease [Rhodoflexus sp.]